MKSIKHVATAGAAACALANAASAEDYNGVNMIAIDDFIGTVEIKVGRGDRVSLNKTDGADADYPVIIDTDDGVLSIRSHEDPSDMDWWREVSWKKYKENAFTKFLEDYPTIRLTVPEGTDLQFVDTVMMLTAGDVNGHFDSGGHIEGAAGNLKSADVKIHGSADLVIGNVKEDLDISIHGSGDFRAGTAARLDAAIHGSGDIVTGKIAGPASARIHGSGDIEMGDVAGAGEFEIHGSGDIDAGALDGGADISIMGSGDISVASVNGETEVSIHGSGDSEIGSGRAENLHVRIHGSGEFEFRGTATNPDVVATSSGGIYVAKAEGDIRARGDGDIRIAGRDYSDDD